MIELCLPPVYAFASYWHGRGDGPDLIKQWYESKNAIATPVTALASCAVLYDRGWWAFLGLALAAYYWFTFRSNRQAHAEINYMRRFEESSLWGVTKQYLVPAGAVWLLIIALSAYQSKYNHMYFALACALSIGAIAACAKIFRGPKGRVGEDEIGGVKERARRSYVEIANGASGGLHMAAIASLV